MSAGSIFTHVVSFCIFPPSLITPRFRTVKGLFAFAHRPQQPPVCTAHRVAGPSRITHQDDLSSGWRHHVAPCAPISSLSYPRRSLVPCIAKQWKNTLSFLRCRRLKLERRGSRITSDLSIQEATLCTLPYPSISYNIPADKHS